MSEPEPGARQPLPRRVPAILAGLACGLLLLEGTAQTAKSIEFGTAVRVDNAPRTSRPIESLFRSRPPTRRLLVLGDSMAYSPGVSSTAVWSARLEEMLNQHGPPTEVVNLAVGGINTYAQLQLLSQALDHQEVDLVLLLYNHNDVYGRRSALDLGSIDTQNSADSTDEVGRAERPSSSPADRPMTRGIQHRQAVVARTARWLRQRSFYSTAAFTRIGLQLRAWGVLVPGTEFHHMARRGYLPEFPGWNAVQQELAAMQNLAERASTRLAIYVLPQFASLRHDFFSDVRKELAGHADRIGTTIGFGFPAFEGDSWHTYAMSPFDGHPNERANQRIAEVIFEWLQEEHLLAPVSLE